jgi:signal transduction histidine kinase
MAAPDDDPLTRAWARAVAGEVAVDVAAELAPPLAELRDRLALLVDRIDRHISSAPGPEPYPWRSLQAMRQDLATAYLETTSLTRTAADLAATVGSLGAAPAEIDDLERHVEAAVQLARGRISGHVELLVDAGWVPPVIAPAGELVLAVSRMVAACAASAAGVDRASLSVRARAEEDPDGPSWVVISAVDNGDGAPAAAAELAAVLAPFAEGLGGSFVGTSEPGQGSAFELRLPAVGADGPP